MNRLTNDKRAQIVRCLVEGCSVRSTTRMVGCAKGTVLRLLVDLGDLCAGAHDARVRNVTARSVEVDELWAYCHTREQNVKGDDPEKGDVWTWIGFDADTKLMLSWHLGDRTPEGARAFLFDLAGRMRGRFQLSSDGLRAYCTAVPEVFGESIDFAQIVKYFGVEGKPYARSSHAQASVIGMEKHARIGNPDMRAANTSYVERNNLNVRMGMRRYTRLTNGFSKKLWNMGCALSLHAFHNNFIRVHSTLRTVPAVAAGLIDKPMSFDDLMGMLEDAERRTN